MTSDGSSQVIRLPSSAHDSQPWRIHDLAPDFRLEDVWQLPGLGGPDDFSSLVRSFASFDPSESGSCLVRALFDVRWKLGGWLGWDDPATGIGSRVPTLRDRLPADLRDGPSGPESALPFSSLYLTDDEWAAELANRTVHGIVHIGRVAEPTGGFRTRMAVLVKPNGLLGQAYMVAIKPFRHLIVYPSLLRDLARTSGGALT